MNADETFSEVSDEEIAQRKKIENAKQTMRDDIKWLMSSPRGRRIFWWLLEITHVYRSSLAPDLITMARLEGERNVGLQVHAKIMDHCPDAFMTTLNEHKEN